MSPFLSAFLHKITLISVDSVEDFQQVRNELSDGKRKDFRRSRLRDFISGPQLDTFRQLTPTATAFHANPRAPRGLSQFSPPRTTDGLPAMRQFAAAKDLAIMGGSSGKPNQRVTIHFDNGTPTLHMRFSALEIPPLVFNNAKSRPQSEWAPVSRPVSYHPSSYPVVPPSAPSVLSTLELSDSGPPLATLPRSHYSTRRSRAQSSYSIPESYTSLSDVRELASQFPGPPIRVLETVEHSPIPNAPGDFWEPASPTSSEDIESSLSHNSSMPSTSESLRMPGLCVESKLP